MKKFVLKLDLPDDKAKQKAMKTVSTLLGIDAISMDMKGKKLLVIGTVDPVSVVTKLRKYWPATDIILVGPVKEPEKKEEPKKEEPKKEEDKKEEQKKEEDKKEEPKKEEAKKEEDKKEGEKKEEKKDEKKEEEKKEAPAPGPAPAPAPVPDPILEMVKAYRAYNPHMYNPYMYNPYMTTYHYVQSMEENPNSCVIF